MNDKETVFLRCGIAASVLYVVMNIIVPLQWREYNSASQTVSELSAVGAPTRMVWIVLSAPYTLLMIAFSWGVLRSAQKNRLMRVAGNLLLIYSLLGILWPFVPMHLRPALAAGGATVSDTLHIVLGAITEIIYLVVLGLMATALGPSFRRYSIATLLVLLVFGVFTFAEASDVGLNKPTPMIGVWERINIGAFLLWVIVLAVVLERRAKLQVRKIQMGSTKGLAE